MPNVAKYGNATLEISTLTLVLYLIHFDYDSSIMPMLSPMAWVYFYFIILSTLRLSSKISIYTGFMAGLQYVLLSLYLLDPNDTKLDLMLRLPYIYIGKGFIFFLSGVAAEYVGMQIQKSIESSIEMLENQNKIIALFGQQVSPEIAKVMVEQKGLLESKHMKVAIMFLDIRNFTKFADKHSAEEIVEYQNSFFGIVVDVVAFHGGIVNQFLGDGCMITFGAPVPLENPSEKAVMASLDVIAEIQKAGDAGKLPTTTVGIGIHTGDAVTGNIGSELRQQYNITGNVVIQASRIEQLNKEYNSQLLVSKEVMEELSNKPAARSIGSVQLKGIEEEMFVYQVV